MIFMRGSQKNNLKGQEDCFRRGGGGGGGGGGLFANLRWVW